MGCHNVIDNGLAILDRVIVCRGLAAFSLNACNDLIGDTTGRGARAVKGASEIINDNRATSGCEQTSMCSAQSAPCACDQGYLSIKSKIVHIVSLVGLFGCRVARLGYGVVLNLEMEPGSFTVMGCYDRCRLDGH